RFYYDDGGNFIHHVRGLYFVLLLRESFSGTMMGRRYWLGDLLLLGSAACWASYTVYSQPLLTKVRPLALTSVSMAAGGLPLLILGLPEIARMEPTRISLTAWGGLGYATLMALVVGYLAWSQGVSVLGSTRTAIYLNLVPVVAVVVAWWWLGERLGLVQALGATGVVLGIGLSRSGSVQGAAA
ncbi:MAG: EamA family transporter, partial [Acidobacteriota bacterium]